MRRFLHDLTVLAAVTAAGGYALTRATTPALPHAPFALKPLVVDHPPVPLDDAMHVLRNASEFAGAAVGYGGTVPTAVVAWLTIVSHPSARNLFQDLLHTGTPAGRMYGLAGLRAIHIPLFRVHAEPLRRSRAWVNTLFGCIGSTMTTAEIVAELDRGTWIGEFVTASKSRYYGDLPWPAIP